MGIVEFIMYGSAKYFRECYMVVSPSLNNPSVVFGYKKTEYLEDKIKKAQQHTVTRMGPIFFCILQKRGNCKYMEPRGIWLRYGGNIHLDKYSDMVHSRSNDQDTTPWTA